jgi:hypothetical protein
MTKAEDVRSFLASRLRDRAEEARAMGETFHDPVAQGVMQEIAERYETLAGRLESES